MNKEYLGDSVFAAIEGETLVLTTENGTGMITNRICLEPEAREKLVEYLDELKLSQEVAD
jgi:hypothetical protein